MVGSSVDLNLLYVDLVMITKQITEANPTMIPDKFAGNRMHGAFAPNGDRIGMAVIDRNWPLRISYILH